MKIQYTFLFRLNPTLEQNQLLLKHMGSVRYIFNYFLNEQIEHYKTDKKIKGFNYQCKQLTILKNQPDHSWLYDVNSQSLQYSLKCLHTAYSRFFRKKANFPKFKSKRHHTSFTVLQDIKIKNNRLYIPKFNTGIKINLHRPIIGIIKKCTITKTSTNKYFVSILTERNDYNHSAKTYKQIGIDLGLINLVTTSDNIKFKNYKVIKKYEKKLAKSQKCLSRKQKGSRRYENQRLKVAKIHEKIKNSRIDNLHKLSNKIICENDIICVENLNTKGLIKNRRLAKHISDVSWATFIRFLEYKAQWNDKTLVKIDRYFPSSKQCNGCGWKKNDLTLKDRLWKCDACGITHDRDINAAKNILDEGLKILSLRTSDYIL